jgi:hypothetical protein
MRNLFTIEKSQRGNMIWLWDSEKYTRIREQIFFVDKWYLQEKAIEWRRQSLKIVDNF